MSQLTGGRTVPRVFIGGECIGGGFEASAMQQFGELKKEFKVPYDLEIMYHLLKSDNMHAFKYFDNVKL